VGTRSASHAVSAWWQEPTEGIHRLGVEPGL